MVSDYFFNPSSNTAVRYPKSNVHLGNMYEYISYSVLCYSFYS